MNRLMLLGRDFYIDIYFYMVTVAQERGSRGRISRIAGSPEADDVYFCILWSCKFLTRLFGLLFS